MLKSNGLNTDPGGTFLLLNAVQKTTEACIDFFSLPKVWKIALYQPQ